MSDIGQAVWDAMPESFRREWRQRMAEQSGSARQALWSCKDGWIVGYTTERVRGGGKLEGKFVTLAYKPVGKGARTGKASEHVLVYKRAFSQRKMARTRAEALYNQHS